MDRLWLYGILIIVVPLLACIGGVVWFTYHTGYSYGAKAVQAAWDTEKAAIITAQRTKEAALQSNMDKLRTEKNRETAKLQRTVAALTDSLRSRPDRPVVPASAGAGDGAPGCTGAELYRSDSEFLVRLAERADTLRLALKDCQDAYRAASGR